jgi:trehalose/maltose hydrolase-like predicted phosphorylase
LKRSSDKNRKKNKGKPENRDWVIEYDEFQPAEEPLREALCTLANGYFGTRGAAYETKASRISYPGTYMAGVYNKVPTRIAGRKIYNEDLVNCPNWLYITFRLAGGKWISFREDNILSYEQRLMMRSGLLNRKTVFRDNKGRRIEVRSKRLVDMEDRHIGAIKYTIKPENGYRGTVYIRAGLDGTVQNTGVERYSDLNSRHLRAEDSGGTDKGIAFLSVKTSQSGIKICQASKLRLRSGQKELRPEIRVRKEKKKVYQDLSIEAFPGKEYTLEKTVAIYTSLDENVKDPLKEAVSKARRAPVFEDLERSQKKKWKSIWERCALELDAPVPVNKIINFHNFHLMQSATVHNEHIDAGLPARGLHGESYRGHIFWDELFVMPVYDYHIPLISRSLIMYRYRRLDKAREYARRNGYRGAMFPWQSGATGEEETQVVHLNPMSGKWGPDYSRNQRHISFAIAYNVWNHFIRSGDVDFLTLYGAEIIFSIAEFGSSLVKYSEDDRRYHTHGLMGPDEFHEKMPLADEAGYTDNAYTNVLIVWTLRTCLKIIDLLPDGQARRIMKKAGIGRKSLDRWRDIVKKMNVIISEDGIIEQFEGYFGLKELDWEHYKRKYGNIHRMDRILKAEGKSPNEYKVAKQADVLMLFYLFRLEEIKDIFRDLGYGFSMRKLRKNYDYYLKRTSHGSTLSKVVHCYLAHILGIKKQTWKWYLDVLDSDIHDVQGGTTPEGIHTGVMGGSIDILLRGFAGIEIIDGVLCVDPKMPARIRTFRFSIIRGRCRVELEVSNTVVKTRLNIKGRKKKGLKVKAFGREREVKPGREYTFRKK